MGQECETIISDGGTGIEEGIKRLQMDGLFHGVHLLDAYHAMKTCKVQHHNRPVLRQLYLSTTKEEYEEIYYEKMAYLGENEQEKFMKFDRIADRFCLAKIPPTFVGLGASTSMS